MSCELVILFYVYSCLENFLHALFLLHIVTLGAVEPGIFEFFLRTAFQCFSTTFMWNA